MAFVVTETGLAAVAATPQQSFASQVRLGTDTYANYFEIWRRQPQVRTVVGFLARNIAQLGIHTFRRISDVDRPRLPDHPLAQLLGRPAPGLTRYRLIERLVSDLAIYDTAYWVKIKPNGSVPAGLVPVPVAWMTPLGGSWFEPEGYLITGNRGRKELAAEDVVHFHGYNPMDLQAGMSPMVALQSLLVEEFEASRYRQAMWRNGAKIGGYLTRPAEAPDWIKSGGRQRFLETWREYRAGGGDEGGTPLLEEGVDFKSASFDAQQAQYIESRRLSREEVAAAYYIPPPLVGILDHATFSNITEQHKNLYQDTLGPWLEMIQQDIEAQILPDLPDRDRVYVEFNIRDKLKGSFEEEAATLSTATGAPYLTRNEARARQNLPQIDGGDDLVTPLNVLVGGLASPQDTAPPALPKARRRAIGRKADRPAELGNRTAEQGAFEKALAVFFGDQAAAVLKALEDAGGDIPDPEHVWDKDAWDKALAGVITGRAFRLAQVAAWTVLGTHNPDGSGWAADVMLPWLAKAGQSHAQHINAATLAGLAAAVHAASADTWRDAAGSTFEQLTSNGPGLWAQTIGTEATGFGSHDAAGASGLATKTWIVRATNPRPSHAAQNGETVSIDDVFSNGARFPGDPTLGAAENANCTCDVSYGTE